MHFSNALEHMSPRIGRFGVLAFAAYPVPLTIAVLAWVPFNAFCGILFSAHGGLGWLFLLLSFPWLLIRAAVLFITGPVEDRAGRQKEALLVLFGYVPISVLCAYSLIGALNPPLMNTLKNVLVFLYFPLTLLLPEA